MLLTVLLPMPVMHGTVSQTGLIVYIAHCINASVQATYLCFQSAPEAGACWHPAFRKVTERYTSLEARLTTASDACGSGHPKLNLERYIR